MWFFFSNITFQNNTQQKKYFPAVLLLDEVAGGLCSQQERPVGIAMYEIKN